MDALDLLQSHKYAEAVAACRQRLAVNPNDFGAIATMASALCALKKYQEALSLFERVDAHEKESIIAPGQPGRQENISCLYWFLGNRQKAIALMRGLVDGILDGSIQYGDMAGGMKQGLLLYYMAVTERQPEQAACALDYMRNRISQLKRLLPPGIPIDYSPVPVARYYLGDLAFDELLVFATGQRELPEAIAAARVKLMSRRQLCVALFHDGAKSRAQGAEDRCLVRMRECYALEDPVIEPEWYLARHEVEQAAAKA
jgi:tetratricopeptide (TPR) repeat protein